MADSKIWARYYINLGRYNLCSNEKDWCLQLQTSGGNFSETWPEDEKPNVDGMLPSQVLDLIEEQLRSFWVSSGRDEKLKRMEEWRKRAHEYDEAWLLRRIEETEEQRANLSERLDSVRAEMTRETAVAE